MSCPRVLRSLVFGLALLATASASAQELNLIGKHGLEGARGGVAYGGTIEVFDDATYELSRSYADGRREQQNGTVRLDGSALVLEDRAGMSGILVGNGAQARPFERDRAEEKRVRFVWSSGADRERIDLGKGESKWKLVRRLLKKGREVRWLVRRNKGTVEDPGAGLWIQRMRQPRPKDLREFKQRGGRTVLSLNGDQDKEGTLVRWSGIIPKRTKVNLQDYIRQQGLQHHWQKMGASKVPTDAQLIEVFRVLLDDSKRPILLHCTGGADRTGVVSALYAIEFLGASKAEAKKTMRAHMWAANDGTEIQGAYIDLYQPGTLSALLRQAGVVIPARYNRYP